MILDKSTPAALDNKDVPPVPKKDAEEPPPYSIWRGPSTSSGYRIQPATLGSSASTSLGVSYPPRPYPSTAGLPISPSNNAQATNHINFKTKHDPIAGVFHIDPGLGAPPLLGDKKCRRKAAKKAWWGTSPLAPHARFETRQGALTLSLAAVGPPQAPPARCIVDARTRQGDAEVRVFQIDANRRLSIRVETRQGGVMLLLPREFSGPLHLRARKRHNKIHLLPALQGAARVLSRRDGEFLLLLGDAPLPANVNIHESDEWQGDYASVESRNGEIMVGYVDADQRPNEPGFWKKLGDIITAKLA